jgi:hypothetical protein
MTIGVDAGALSISDERLKVGVWRMTFELLKHLSVLDKVNEYRLYSFQPIEDAVLKSFGKNMRNVVLSPSIGYFSFRLPLELLIHPVDVYLGLSQTIPVMKKGLLIGVVHDLGFIHKPHVYGNDASGLRKQTKNLVKRSGHIVTVSQTVKNDIMRVYGIDDRKISVCHEGVSSVFSSAIRLFFS